MAYAKSSQDLRELNEAVDEIVEDLVCQMCFNFPKPGQLRWYKCSELHNICQSCVESSKLEICPCSAKISKKVDKMTESFLKLKTMMFKCQFCFERFTKGALNYHEAECKMRLVPCPYVSDRDGGRFWRFCEEKVKVLEVLSHFGLNHGKIGTQKNGHIYDYSYKARRERSSIQGLSKEPEKIHAYGKIFLSSAQTKDGVFYEWVQILGSPKDADDFMFSLEYEGPHSTHAFFGKVASINEPRESIISSGKCSSIGFETFKTQFMKGNTCEFSARVTVKKVEDENRGKGWKSYSDKRGNVFMFVN